jgi:hypothetical protein
MGHIGCPETSVFNQLTLRNNPEDEIIQVNRSGGLRSRRVNCSCLSAKLLYFTRPHIVHFTKVKPAVYQKFCVHFRVRYWRVTFPEKL